MLGSNLRIALFVSYIILLLWRSSVAGRLPDNWWMVILVTGVLDWAINLGERLAVRYRRKRALRDMLSMDPAVINPYVHRHVTGLTAQELREIMAAEAQPETDALVERYHFANYARRNTTVAFWGIVAATVVVQCMLILRASLLPQPVGWVLWLTSLAMAIGAAALRSRMTLLDSVLEVSPFSATNVAYDGTRITVRFSNDVRFAARRWPERLEVIDTRRGTTVRMDYDRIGVSRAIMLSLIHAGVIAVPATAVAQGSDKDADAPAERLEESGSAEP